MIFGRAKPNGTPPKTPPPPSVVNHLLLVVEGSEGAPAAARIAIALARRLECRLTAIYVVDTATMDYLLQLRIFVREEREEFERDLEQSGRRSLDAVVAQGRENGVDVQAVMHKGRFHTIILREARALKVDAIVVAGWSHSIMHKDAASVERQLVLEQAECPVLVIKGAPPRPAAGR